MQLRIATGGPPRQHRDAGAAWHKQCFASHTWIVRRGLAVFLALLLATPLSAQQPAAPPNSSARDAQAIQGAEQAAAQLLATTVTVRIAPPKPADAAVANNVARANANFYANAFAAEGVTVCSGVSLGAGLIVTFTLAPDDARYRVTLPGGEQADARLAIVDEYSRLGLLETSKLELSEATLAKALPNVGAAVLTSAASGIEPPVVSLGILGARDRSIPGSGLPPLLQCDVRTTAASSGAPVVNREGQLIGVVAATSAEADRDGWTYALPVSHVERLLKARKSRKAEQSGPVVLKRYRPVVGLTMGQGAQEGTVQVERVEPGGPAARAGIRAGDLVMEADGRKIRSAYQAVDQILKKQPGDEVQLLVQQGQTRRAAKLILEGGASAGQNPSALQNVGQYRVGPQLNVRAMNRNDIELRDGANVAEVSVDSPSEGNRRARDELSLLRDQVTAFAQVIERLQAELKQRDDQQAQTKAELKTLSEEVVELRKQIDKKE